MLLESCRRQFRILAACIMLCVFSFPACGAASILIAADEWTWDEGGIASFHGSITTEKDAAEAYLFLWPETRLEDSGEVLFTGVNGKKLKVRKRASGITQDLKAGIPLEFEAEWHLPEENDSGLARAVIHLSVSDKNGSVIASGELEMGSMEDERAMISETPEYITDVIVFSLAAAAGFCWIAAAFRHFLLNRKGHSILKEQKNCTR